MPYIQVMIGNGYLARALNIGPIARIAGHPGYMATAVDSDDLVRSILFLGIDGRIHLDREGVWTLIAPKDDAEPRDWIFTSMNEPSNAITIGDIETMGGTWREWNEVWANMDTDDPRRGGLVWPLGSWEDAWDYVQAQGLGLHLYMVPNTLFPGGAWVSREDDRMYWGQGAIAMLLIRYKDGRGLRLASDGSYVGCWEASNACRWTAQTSRDRALYFQVDIVHGQNIGYILTYQGKRLNVGQWIFGFLQRQANGVEFFDGNPDVPQLIVQGIIFGGLDGRAPIALDRWILEPWFQFQATQGQALGPINALQITENLPRSGGGCLETEWQGVQMACLDRPIPYAPSIGRAQCTTLDAFQKDPHCQAWAFGEPGIESRLQDLCQDAGDEYMDVCACFLPQKRYYDALRVRYSQRIAEDVRASNLLQCASGLCTGQEGSFSPSLFYQGSRRCDVCIQAVALDLENTTVQGDIVVKQLCTQVDPTYSWEDLLERLQNLGAWKLPDTSPVYRHVIIQADESAIVIDPRSDLAQEALQNLNLLSQISGKDARGRLILSKALWTTNPTTYTNEVIVFFLDARPN